MYAPRVKATPLGGSALMTRRPASGPESDLILGMGTADTTTVPLWDLAQSEFLHNRYRQKKTTEKTSVSKTIIKWKFEAPGSRCFKT